MRFGWLKYDYVSESENLMTTASEPVFDATNPHAMGDDREPLILDPDVDTYALPNGHLALTLAGLLKIPNFEASFIPVSAPPPDITLTNRQIIQGMVLAGTLDPHAQVVPLSLFDEGRQQQRASHRSVHEVIKQIIPLLPVDTPDPDDDFTEFKEELEKFAGAWFTAPECEMPLWIGLATTLEEQMGEPKEDWPEWKRQVLAIFSGSPDLSKTRG